MNKKAEEVRKNLAEIINEDPSKASDYDWVIISGYFNEGCILDVMKYIKDDNVCTDIENLIMQALQNAIRHKESHSGKTPQQLSRGFESIRKRRKMFVDLQHHNEKKHASDSVGDDKAKEEVAKLTTQLKTYEKRIEELEEEIKQLKAQQPAHFEMPEETIESIQLKPRIEVLNLLMRNLGYDIKTINEKKLNSTMVKLYQLILGKGATSLLTPCIGKVTYIKKPEGIDEQVKDINQLLQKINKDWSIKL